LEFVVEIVAWSTYNPRPDRGNFSWFKMENQFFVHMRDRKGASSDATIVLAFLLAECSSANGESFRLRLAFASKMLGMNEKKIHEALLELEKMGDCVLKPASSGLQAASSLDRTGQNGQDRTDTTTAPSAPALDFEKIYSIYPRKEGKRAGMLVCLKQIKTQDDYDRLQKAVEKYCAHLRANATEPRFVKHFGTFMNNWTDWVDPLAGQVRVPPPKNERRYFDERPPEPEFIPSSPDPESLALIRKATGGLKPMPKGDSP
jgi:hypothetical protein